MTDARTTRPQAEPDQIAANDPWLMHFPITFFAVAMGLSGLTLALHAAAATLPWAAALSSLALWGGITVFGLIALIYLLKVALYPASVMQEWQHPVKLAFFPAASISLLLTATALYPTYPAVAHVIWLAGVVGQGVLTIAVISGWISHRSFEVGHLTPAWFIPAVGNVIVPVLGAHLGYVEISWLFFSGGLVFWIVLLTLVMNRLVFHNPIPGRLYPTLVILIAPPALAFIAYQNLMQGQIDPFAHILLSTAYVFTILVLVQGAKLARLPFSLSWWALSFPVAALTIASLSYARLAASGGHLVIGYLSLVALAAIITGLVARTIRAIARGEICRPE